MSTARIILWLIVLLVFIHMSLIATLLGCGVTSATMLSKEASLYPTKSFYQRKYMNTATPKNDRFASFPVCIRNRRRRLDVNCIDGLTKEESVFQTTKMSDSDLSGKPLRSLAGCEESSLNRIDFIHLADRICTTRQVDLLIMVSSSPTNILHRQVIRETWGRNATVVFLLGMTQGQTTQEKILSESRLHSDIVQGKFIDTYRNLTLKTVMGISWVAQKCQQAKFIMKTDDDSFVNTKNLFAFLYRNGTLLQHGMGGRCFGCSRPNRNNGSKWYISHDDYPETFYPGFCSGVGYVMSMRVAHLLLPCFENNPAIPLEDIYVSLCVLRLHLGLFNIPGFIPLRLPSIPCLYKQDELIVAHGVTPRLQEAIWTADCRLGASVNRDYLEEWRRGLIV